MKLFWVLALLALGAVVLPITACQDVASPIENYGWLLYRYGEPGNMKDTLPGTEVTAYFDSKEKIVSGNAGCNTYRGSYETDHLTLTITGPLVMTKISCGAEKDRQEKEFINALQNAESFEVEQGELIIKSGQSQLYFKRAGSGFKTVNYWEE